MWRIRLWVSYVKDPTLRPKENEITTKGNGYDLHRPGNRTRAHTTRSPDKAFEWHLKAFMRKWGVRRYKHAKPEVMLKYEDRSRWQWVHSVCIESHETNNIENCTLAAWKSIYYLFQMCPCWSQKMRLVSLVASPLGCPSDRATAPG